MSPDNAVDLIRRLLVEAVIISSPLLVASCAISLVISLLQTLTGIQEQTLTTVPRLIAVFILTLLTLPWAMHRMTDYTIRLLVDFHKYIG